MVYEKIGSLGRLGRFEGFGQDAASSSLPGVLTGVGQILGEVGKVGALFYAQHQQMQMQEAMTKARLRQPLPPPPPPQVYVPPPKSNLPLILGVLILVMAAGMFMFMQSQKNTGRDRRPND